ncbi:hypothetical protein DDB_G0278357 [Dictyostelium discoideum AX4]|uniref:Uncharacterized protein n=1 Tax=Dictyostelium discoideum TaxID=44689 RepID=Q54Y94_DICDI|nr:hypothetical protein DDB_G0278357 [Dictyostelium discoideum AX4]EAL68351.1 hypothetical protein DDB_G0278357 [Dictyostelium discoideum AX4]|eukprot:XP_642308.1 hypothetical protein DDB_G0278357 [Dictyostelium discoideum AX4]
MFSSSLCSFGRKWTPGAIRNIRKIREQQKQAEIRRKEARPIRPVSIYFKEILQEVKEEEPTATQSN